MPNKGLGFRMYNIRIADSKIGILHRFGAKTTVNPQVGGRVAQTFQDPLIKEYTLNHNKDPTIIP